VSPGIIIPLIVLPFIIVGVFLWYRRSIADMASSEAKPVSGQRLTAEALHRVPSPPWRVVYEIGGALGDVDHVVVGPPGVIAVTTVLADRPEPAALIGERGEPMLLSEAAIARGPLDELLRAVDASCKVSARVFWGTPAPGRRAGEDVVHGSVLVEGQRITEWLDDAAASTADAGLLDEVRIDAIWRTIVTGIGRPDPRP
jgi:hypothetical protein